MNGAGVLKGRRVWTNGAGVLNGLKVRIGGAGVGAGVSGGGAGVAIGIRVTGTGRGPMGKLWHIVAKRVSARAPMHRSDKVATPCMLCACG